MSPCPLPLYDVFPHPQPRFSELATFGEKRGGLDELEQEHQGHIFWEAWGVVKRTLTRPPLPCPLQAV